MLRSLVCPDIEEDEGISESEDEGPSCSSAITHEERNGQGNITGLTSFSHISSGDLNIIKDKSKRFLETAQERLRNLKSMYGESSQNKIIQNRGKNSLRTKMKDVESSRKRKIYIGDMTVKRPIIKSKTCGVEKSSKTSRLDSKEGATNHKMTISEAIKEKSQKSKTVKCVDKITLDHLTEQDFVVHDVYDPNRSKKSRIEKDLDEAITNKDFQLAQSISDEMSERELSGRIANNFDALSYLQKKKREKEAQDKKKKKLKWMFDHKERWEVKGNM